jgi:hypothetical protein
MDSQVVPTLDTLRQWLDDAGITFFECDSCQALHLPHMQNFDGIFDAKIDLINDVILFSALAEVKPSALLALAADLSAINASSLTVKAFLDIQDDNLPKLVVCQSLFSGAGVTFKQFAWFMRQSEEQISWSSWKPMHTICCIARKMMQRIMMHLPIFFTKPV